MFPKKSEKKSPGASCPRVPKSREKVSKKSRAEIFETMAENSGLEKGVFRKRGLFNNVHFLEVRENSVILESSQGVENKRESDHFL